MRKRYALGIQVPQLVQQRRPASPGPGWIGTSSSLARWCLRSMACCSRCRLSVRRWVCGSLPRSARATEPPERKRASHIRTERSLMPCSEASQARHRLWSRCCRTRGSRPIGIRRALGCGCMGGTTWRQCTAGPLAPTPHWQRQIRCSAGLPKSAVGKF